MNYEKEYKEALERAKDLHDNHPLGQPLAWITCEKIFPVLKKSDDERIRKGIICGMNALKEQHKETFASIPINDCIAWLEKQGEQKPNFCHHEVDFSNCSEEYRKAYYDGWNNCNQQHAQLEAEQKSVDKVEPKFKIGDTVTVKPMSCHGKVFKGKPFSIVDIIEDNYVSDDGKTYNISLQDGWELVEQNISWSEEDELMIKDAIHWINEFQKSNRCKDENDMQNSVTCENWLKSIKNRVQPKQEWSKEDEEMYKEVLTDIIYAKNDLKTKRCLELSKRAMKAFNWFSKRYKSLRPQSKWKPSDEQLRAIINSAQGLYQCKEKEVLLDLYEQLKNL